MKHIYAILFSLFAVVLISSNTLNAQAVNVTALTVLSPPATSCTNTIVVASGTLSAANYIYNGTTISISGSNIVITINYLAGIIILPAIVPFTDTVNLGMLAPGTYTVTTYGTLNATIQSTLVTPLSVISCCPAVSSFTMSDTSICPGDSVSMTNTSTGAVNQAWYENNVLVSNNQNYNTGVLNTPGTYTYKLVVDDGSCSDSTEQTLVVHPFPTVDLGNDTSLCGGSITLDAGAGRDSIDWSTSASSRFITVDSTGNYQVTVYENGCSASDDINITFLPAPSVDLGPDSIICDGDTLVLSATQPGLSYEWQDASVNSVFAASDSGIYWVKVTNANGCSDIDSVTIGLKDCSPPIGITDAVAQSIFTIYPNPADEFVRILLPSEADRTEITIELYDMQGKKVATRTFNNASEVIEMPIALATGNYIIKLSDAVQQHWTGTVSVRK